MQLNTEGRARLQAHLQKVLRNPCSVCGSGNWQVDDTIFELRQFAGGGLSAQGSIKPVATITCNGCGNILFMSPLTTGVLQVQQAPPSAAVPSSASPSANGEGENVKEGA